MREVLIVEDDPRILQLTVVNLNIRGYNTLVADTVQAGIKLIKTHRLHLVILDLKLLDGSGWDILRAIDADPQTIKPPVLIMTASSLDDDPEYPYSHLIGKLSKPFSLAELLGAVTAPSAT